MTRSKNAVAERDDLSARLASAENYGVACDRVMEALTATNVALLFALDACETALSPNMANHDCGDAPGPGKRCGECLGCLNQATWQMARDALAKVRGVAVMTCPPHRYVIDPPNGGKSRGVCQLCGHVRTYFNTFEETIRGPADIQQLRAQPARNGDRQT